MGLAKSSLEFAPIVSLERRSLTMNYLFKLKSLVGNAANTAIQFSFFVVSKCGIVGSVEVLTCKKVQGYFTVNLGY